MLILDSFREGQVGARDQIRRVHHICKLIGQVRKVGFDEGGEFTIQAFKDVCSNHHIMHEVTRDES